MFSPAWTGCKLFLPEGSGLAPSIPHSPAAQHCFHALLHLQRGNEKLPVSLPLFPSFPVCTSDRCCLSLWGQHNQPPPLTTSQHRQMQDQLPDWRKGLQQGQGMAKDGLSAACRELSGQARTREEGSFLGGNTYTCAKGGTADPLD